jgi:hypothetical protein
MALMTGRMFATSGWEFFGRCRSASVLATGRTGQSDRFGGLIPAEFGFSTSVIQIKLKPSHNSELQNSAARRLASAVGESERKDSGLFREREFTGMAL